MHSQNTTLPRQYKTYVMDVTRHMTNRRAQPEGEQQIQQPAKKTTTSEWQQNDLNGQLSRKGTAQPLEVAFDTEMSIRRSPLQVNNLQAMQVRHNPLKP